MISVQLKPEYIAAILGLSISNTFFTSLIVTIILAVAGLFFYFKRNNSKSLYVNIFRVVIYELLKLTDMVTRDRKLSKKIMPVISTFFIFIVTANLLALIPGFLGSFYVEMGEAKIAILRSPNSDLTTTLALAIFSVLSIQWFSISVLGPMAYLKRFFNPTGPIKFILGFFELISESVKIVSFSFRLFGNIFSGEVLLLVIAFLVPYFIPLPFMILEVFVGFIQAFIFAVLTLTFIKTSTLKEFNN